MNPPSQNFGVTGDVDRKLDRLLQSAALTKDDAPVEAPFGFDTRVVALWKSGASNGNNGLTRLMRRVAILALAVIVASSAATLYETNRDRERSEPFSNAFAIADSAIESELP